MWDFLVNLFATAGFTPRWHCGAWTTGHGVLHIASDVAIFGAYSAIPLVLAYFVLRRKDVPFPPIFWLFALFIFSCGAGHLIEATLFWQPWYRFAGLVKLMTATVSWATVFALAAVIPQALHLPGLSKMNRELEREIEQRRRAEDLFRRALEVAPNAMVMVDQKGKIVMANGETERLFGYDRDELVGKQIEILIPERLRASSVELRQKLVSGPQGRPAATGREFVGLRRDGCEFPVEVGLNPFETADGPMILSAIVDVSERHQALEASRNLAAIVDSSSDAIVGESLDGRIQSWNSGAERLYKFKAADVIGKPSSIILPPDRRNEASLLFDRLKQGLPVQSLETQRRRSDGSVIDISLTISPIRDSAGRLIGTSSIGRDISRQKRAEATLKTLNRTLEDRVEQRTRFVMLLKDVAVIANNADTIKQAFQQAVDQICSQMEWPIGHAYLADEVANSLSVDMPDSEDAVDDSQTKSVWSIDALGLAAKAAEAGGESRLRSEAITKKVLESGQPLWTAEVPKTDALMRMAVERKVDIAAMFAFPVIVGDRVVGVFEFFLSNAERPDDETLNVLSRIGTQLGRVVERKELERAIDHLTENEQRRIGQELHDGLGQELTALSLQAKSLWLALKAEQSPSLEKAESLANGIPLVVKAMRSVIRGLMPVEIDRDGISAALLQLANTTQERFRVSCKLLQNDQVQVDDPSVAHHLFRIAQEAVNNAVKHGDPKNITIDLRSRDDLLVLAVHDDGCGVKEPVILPKAVRYRGMGLRIMQHRASLIGGAVRVERAKGTGTLVTCSIKRKAAPYGGTR